MSKFGNTSVGFYSTSGNGGGGSGLTFQQVVGYGNSSTNNMEIISSGVGQGDIYPSYIQFYGLNLSSFLFVDYSKIHIKNQTLGLETFIQYDRIKITPYGSNDFVQVQPLEYFNQSVSMPSCNGRLEYQQTPFISVIDLATTNFTIGGTVSGCYVLISSSNTFTINLAFGEGLSMYLFIPSTIGIDSVIFTSASPIFGLTDATQKCGLVVINKTNGAYWIGV